MAAPHLEAELGTACKAILPDKNARMSAWSTEWPISGATKVLVTSDTDTPELDFALDRVTLIRPNQIPNKNRQNPETKKNK